MEKDVKIGSLGDVDVQAGLASEKAAGSVVLGPLKISLVAELDNRALLELVASKVPGGFSHEAVIALEKLLFPEQASAPAGA
jgi:hypothetical protein